MAAETLHSLSQSIKTAEKTAKTLLRSIGTATHLRPQAPDLPSRVQGLSSLIWWDDRTPLFEFALEKVDGLPGGYALISTHPKIPAVVQYSLDGPPLSQQVMRFWLAYSATRSEAPVSRLYYLGPFDLAIRLANERDGKSDLVSIPFCERLQTGALIRDPRKTWPISVVRRVHNVVGRVRRKSPAPSTILELVRRPARYTQNCSDSGQASGTPCSPACISGCGPVAWAMLASAYRRGHEIHPVPDDTYGHIFAGRPNDWWIDWPSQYSPNPKRSSMVNAHIWALHGLMQTSCSGETLSDDPGTWPPFRHIFQDPEQYIRTVFNCDTIASSFYGSNDFPTHKRVLDQGTPFIFCGDRNWFGNVGGHCVVTYGYNDALGYDLICLGWGSGWSDQYIPPESVGGFSFILFKHLPGHGRMKVTGASKKRMIRIRRNA